MLSSFYLFFTRAYTHTHTHTHTQPPPPGVAPTAAQVAASQGQSVVMSQQRKDVWGGGSDGGYTIF